MRRLQRGKFPETFDIIPELVSPEKPHCLRYVYFSVHVIMLIFICEFSPFLDVQFWPPKISGIFSDRFGYRGKITQSWRKTVHCSPIETLDISDIHGLWDHFSSIFFFYSHNSEQYLH